MCLHSGKSLDLTSLYPQSEKSAEVQSNLSAPNTPSTQTTVLSSGYPRSWEPAFRSPCHRLCSTAQTWPFLLFSRAFCNSGAQVVFNSFCFSSGCPMEDTPGAAATEASCRDRVCGALDRFFLIKTPELHRSTEARSHATARLLTQNPGDLKRPWPAPDAPAAHSRREGPRFTGRALPTERDERGRCRPEGAGAGAGWPGAPAGTGHSSAIPPSCPGAGRGPAGSPSASRNRAPHGPPGHALAGPLREPRPRRTIHYSRSPAPP